MLDGAAGNAPWVAVVHAAAQKDKNSLRNCICSKDGLPFR